MPGIVFGYLGNSFWFGSFALEAPFFGDVKEAETLAQVKRLLKVRYSWSYILHYI